MTASTRSPHDSTRPTDAPLPPALAEDVRGFLCEALRFATIATVSPDGSPHQAVVWYELEPDGAVLINSAEGRRWPSNLRRDPRIAFSVEDGYDWVSLRGEVEIIDDPELAQADIARLAGRYHADDPAVADEEIRRFRTQRRVSFLLRPTAVHAELGED